MLAGDVDAVRPAAAHVAVLDVQQAGSGVGVQSYRFVPLSWNMDRTVHYATRRHFSEFMSKSPGKELQHCSGRSNEHDMYVSYGGWGWRGCDAASLGEWFPTFRRLSSWTD